MPSALATVPADANEFHAPPSRSRPARRIRDDAEAIGVAEGVAAQLAQGAAERDRDRILPYEEMELISDAGLLAVTVPKAYGGAGVRAETVARIIAALSRADGSIGQIPQNHFFMLEGLRLEGSEEQKRFFYGRVLAGERLGNALSETGTKTAHDHATLLTRDRSIYRLNGRKFYSTGVLFAHWVAVVANDEENVSRIAFVPRDTDGITIIDDWSGFGQRVTGSGTTVLKDVPVHPFSVLSFSALFERPTSMGPFAQIMHAAVEQGIAEAALADTVQFVRTSARPYKDAGVDRASDDPYTVAIAGELKIRVDASSALLARAGTFVDRAQASVAVAEAKIASTEAALLVASKLIELGGSSATLVKHGFDRHWRNARTHTVHDPVRWKYRAVGDYWLNGVNPPRHGAI
jgi:SfnB family sulfur acquisition oxidoreductase